MSTAAQCSSEDSSPRSGTFNVSETSEGDGALSNISIATNTAQPGTSDDKKEDTVLHNTTGRDLPPLTTRTIEHMQVLKEHDEDEEVEVLLCLLEQRLSTSVNASTHEQNQQLWETLRSLVPKYRDRTGLLRRRTTELEQRLAESKQECLRKCEKLLDEHRCRLKAVTDDYEKQHLLALERASNARQQAESLLLQLADAQAEIKCLKAQMHTKTQELRSEHLRDLLEVTNEKDLQLRVKNSECQEAAMLNRNLQQQNLAYKTRLETELTAISQQKVELEARLKAQESLNQDLMSVLEKERSLNQELTSAIGRHENQVALLEHQLYTLQSEGKHKDLLLQALNSKVSQDIALGATNTGSSHLPLQQQAVSRGTSTAGSSNADSGVQVTLSSGRSRGEEVSVCSVASQVSPPTTSAELDQTLGRLTSQINEKSAAVLEAKRLLRSTTNDLHKLTKLAEQRAEQLRRLQSRMQGSSTATSTPGGCEYKGSSSNESAFDARASSSGFVPHMGPPSFSRTVRKTYVKKLASTAEESLADVSSIDNSKTLGSSLPPFEFHSEDTFCASDDVFEFTWAHEKSPRVNDGTNGAAHSGSQHPVTNPVGATIRRPHRPVKSHLQRLQEESRVPNPVFKINNVHSQTELDPTFSFGSKQVTSISDKPLDTATPIKVSSEKVDPTKQSTLRVAATDTLNPVQKVISRSPWEQGPSCWKNGGTSHAAQSMSPHDYLLMGNNRVWGYAPGEEKGPAVKPAKPSPYVESGGKKGARRSLHFPEEASWPTMPFTFCTGANSEASASYELPFRSQPVSTPVNVTVHVQTYPEPKDFRR